MVRVAVSVNLPDPPESTRSLSRHFTAINSASGGHSIQCSVCKTRDKANPRLLVKGQKFVCGSCSKAKT